MIATDFAARFPPAQIVVEELTDEPVRDARHYDCVSLTLVTGKLVFTQYRRRRLGEDHGQGIRIAQRWNIRRAESFDKAVGALKASANVGGETGDAVSDQSRPNR